MTRVLFLILDAFDPSRLSPRLTPNLWSWANADGAATGVGEAVMAACTYPNHATFVTGKTPSQHGIHTNHVIDGDQVKGAWEVGPRGTTLFERLAGLETVAVLGDHHLVGVMGAEQATRHWPPGGDTTSVAPLDLLGYPADEAVLPQLTAALGAPADLVVGYLGSIDTISHIYGPDSAEAVEAYRAVDEKVGLLNDALSSDWEEWMVVVVSDHVQDTVEGPGIDLRVLFPDDQAGLVLDEGSAALVSGLPDVGGLNEVEGVAGWRSLHDGTVLVWSEPGRYFGAFTEPVFRGIHGAEHTRTQLVLVSGGSPNKQPLAAEVTRGVVPATYWSGAIEKVLAGR